METTLGNSIKMQIILKLRILIIHLVADARLLYQSIEHYIV
jgi:hypothetical protein